ncbi:BMC domain-containing protein [Lentilactobacillus kisonensis]|uniref:BMC domain protein n=1 Tax=Lentilactobacillus kisonensis DSM 19906 = JCM 15041 TaxID=1423766 RepID=A0A0R1NWQ0_9LACO|nr:BMC domain-containing protein [Lentilactobacillus kisonensis]KRL22162.1 BMC domain protein [Lentilactobacillus kisonensis DSM 19906 = JCM 15041]
MESIGYLEVEGLSGAIVAADRMLKTAQVQLKVLENTKGNGWITVSVTGDVAAVEAAIDAGKGEMGDRVAGSMVIANPAPGISELGKNDAIKSKFDAATEYDDSNDDGPDDDGPDGGAASEGPKDNGPKDGGSNGGSSTTPNASSTKKDESKPETKPTAQAATKPADKLDSKPTTTKAATTKSTSSKTTSKSTSQAARTKRSNTRRTPRKQTKK